MAGTGAVLHRQKARIPKWTLGLVGGLPTLGGLIAALVLLATGALTWLPALAIIGGSALLGALLFVILVVTGVARLTVSEGELNLQMGMGGTRVPISEITGVSVGASGERRVGVGVRRRLDGTRIYNMMGDNARAVIVERADEPKLVFVCREPEALAEALEKARARAPRVRVAVDEQPEELPVEAATDAKAKQRAR